MATTAPPSSSTPPTVGPSVLRMSGPLVVSFWMRSAFTFVDTIYAARIGDEAVAAIGLTVPFEFAMIALWVGLSTGLTSCLARAMGARQGARIEQYLRGAWTLVWIASAIFLALGIGIWVVAPRLDLPADVRHQFWVYGSVLIAGSAFTTFWSVIPDSLVKAHHDTHATMWAGIWSNVINLVLNTVFLFVFGWGILGIALSTVLGRIGGLIYALVQARRHELRRKASGRDDRPGLDPAPYRSLLALAVPASLTFGLMGAETAIVNVLLADLEMAIAAIAAYSIFSRVTMFAITPVIAMGVAMLPFAARRFGEDDVAGVKRGLRDAGLVAAAYSLLVVGPTMLLAGPWIADALTESPFTREITAGCLRAAPLACLFAIPFLLCRPVFEAMSRGTPGLVVAALRYVAILVPLAWLGMRLARELGVFPLYGLVAGMLAAATVTSVAFVVWTRAALSEWEHAPARRR